MTKSNLYNITFTAFFVLLVFFLSLNISPFYVEGDQFHYRAVYRELPELGLIEGFIYYSTALSSLEVVHFILSWIASRVIEKDFFIAISNAILAYATIRLFIKWNVSLLIAALFILTNFYWLVFYFAAERLKFAVIFFLLSMVSIDNVKTYCALSVVTLISHVQFVLIYAAIMFQYAAKKMLRLIRTGLISKYFILIILLPFIPVLIIQEQLISKFNAYYVSHDFLELFKVLVFFGLSLWYSSKRFETISVFIPIIVATYLVGGDRVNFFGYFVFLYYALPVNRGFNIGILATSIYYMTASFSFMENIFVYGNGFPSN